MLDGISMMLISVVILALSFDFITGFHDTANSIATCVSTRVLTPMWAILMASTLNFVGALVSENVAKTIYKGIVLGPVAEYVIIAALVGAIVWDIVTWYLAIPSSSSHALIGGLIGASVAYAMAFEKVDWSGVFNKVVIPLLTSPIIGFIVGFGVMTFLFRALASVSLRVINKWFSKLQILSAAFMSYAHGNNDAQKSMGIITLALVSAGVWDVAAGVPLWVKISCAVAMGLGTSVGGWKIIKTMGVNIIRLQPINGFAAETSAAAVIETASAFGFPVSTTHIVSAAIMGVGASKRMKAVRWNLVRSIVWAWVLTIPVTALLGAGVTLLIKLII
ncbi:MAG: inorganic phosphate transporter [Bacillota bacterium]|nr:inorganic phosphate transporter [Bacillota bacterium]